MPEKDEEISIDELWEWYCENVSRCHNCDRRIPVVKRRVYDFATHEQLKRPELFSSPKWDRAVCYDYPYCKRRDNE